MIIVRSVVFPLRINAASAAFVWIFFFELIQEEIDLRYTVVVVEWLSGIFAQLTKS